MQVCRINKTATCAVSAFVEPANSVSLYHLQIDFMSHQIADIGNSVLDHCRPAKRKKKMCGIVTCSKQLKFESIQYSEVVWLQTWDLNSAIGVRFPSCARSRMTALSKSSTLYHSLDGSLLLDQQCAIEEVSTISIYLTYNTYF